MENGEKFSWKKRGASFGYALKGLRRLVEEEHNSRIHMCLAIVAIILGIWLGIEKWEWVAVTGCIGWVIMAEAFNSAIEAVADKVSREHDPLIGKAKDIAAGGVLISAIAALVIGIIIFLPRIIELFK